MGLREGGSGAGCAGSPGMALWGGGTLYQPQGMGRTRGCGSEARGLLCGLRVFLRPLLQQEKPPGRPWGPLGLGGGLGCEGGTLGALQIPFPSLPLPEAAELRVQAKIPRTPVAQA